MSHIHCTTKGKQKHLQFEHYEYIQFQLAHFKRSITSGKTPFMKQLALDIGTSLGNLYKIIRDGTISIMTHDLLPRNEFSALAAFNTRSKHNKPSNHLKLSKVQPFIDDVCAFVLENKKIRSIDEAVHIFKQKHPDAHVCTKTIYNYVHRNLIQIKKMDCLEIVARKRRHLPKRYTRHKGTSIEHRPLDANTRTAFGHWEGDLIVGPRTGSSAALLTLIERQTRHTISLPIKNKSSKQVFMAINTIEKQFGATFPTIFKSITFDNGSEFARFRDIEKHPRAKAPRTTVYFAHPYASWERGSNEHVNKLIRRFFPKGTDFNLISNQEIQNAISFINHKKRRILGFKSSQELFDLQISLLSA